MCPFKMPVYSDEVVALFIRACDADGIIVQSKTLDAAARLVPWGFNKDGSRTDHIIYSLRVDTDADKAKILAALKDMGIPFGYAPAGWPPSAVFEHLRERGLVSGPYKQIFWVGTGSSRITLDN